MKDSQRFLFALVFGMMAGLCFYGVFVFRDLLFGAALMLVMGVFALGISLEFMRGRL